MRQLRAFVTIYQTGQISAAADRLALTQPAVTVMLRELEGKLGVKLFDRTSRGLRRTLAATEAYRYAEAVLAQVEALGSRMDDLAAARLGRLRIACTSTVAQTVLPSYVRRFADAYPGVQLEVHDVSPGDFLEVVLSQRVDLGIGTLESPVPGLADEIFLRDTLSAVGIAGPDFPDGGPITWKQLSAYPLVTVRPGYGVRRRIDAGAREAGVDLNIVNEVSLLVTAVALAEAGVGIAVVPGSLLLYSAHPKVIARRITRPIVERNISLLYLLDRELVPAAEAFRQMLIPGAKRRVP